MISREEAARRLLDAVRNNRRSKWWLDDVYLEKYPREEIERAMNEIFYTFDDEWLEKTLNPNNPVVHPLIQHLVPTGLHPFTILVELGRDLYALKELPEMDVVRKRLKAGAEFWGVLLELEIATDCVRKGFEITLFPKVKNKHPDLAIQVDSEDVFVEIMGMMSSERSREFMNISQQVWWQIRELIPEKTQLTLIPEDHARFYERQVPRIAQMIIEILREGKLPAIIIVDGSAIAAEKIPDEYTSFSFREPLEHYTLELRRLRGRIMQESRQIPSLYLGVVILDVTSSLPDAPKEHLIKIARDSFEEKGRSNILAVLLVRSFKFWRAEDEVLMIRNPKSQRTDILTKLESLRTFSRARPF